MNALRRAVITACALTRTTDLLAGHTGARWFVPEVLIPRFAALGGFDATVFAAQLTAVRSFDDGQWTEYWQRLADERLAAAYRGLATVAAGQGERLPEAHTLFGHGAARSAGQLGRLLEPVAEFVGDRGPVPRRDAIDRALHAAAPIDAARITVSDSLLQAIAYQIVAAWPGGTPARLRAYRRARLLSELLLTALGPALGLDIAVVEISAGHEIVRAVTIFPRGTRRCPVLLVTNGLDGTVAELALPLLKYRNTGLGLLIMELPGSQAVARPDPVAAPEVYRAVLDYLSAHRRVAADRIAMFGMSFGGYWAARTAAVDARVRCVVCCGAPAHRAFRPAGAFGVPEPVLRAMGVAFGARTLRRIGAELATLSLRRWYADIGIPMLVIGGDCDTVVDSRDARELAAAVPNATLRLYPGDDHCAPAHFVDWLDAALRWLTAHLEADLPAIGCEVRSAPAC
ncbi:alpha/beta hydrolase family protein [Nocardia brasiliensis]|uniref:alpha/beta hydrolase family protein n=1 Tax=Nocardia brasiliensis TaxID=37326 RepID=UPI0018959E7A|nr:alpha/beta hydrolase [Nocardia brasiliensis]MBF6542057.1 alpha/beta hydrolase [Nocardia brasiliensis]